MDVGNLDEALQVLNASLLKIKWRLKSASKHRLEIDILALCTGMRPVVMIDYGGKMPELQHHLFSLLELIQRVSPVFEHLRILVIEEMIYLIHVKTLAKYAHASLRQESELHFVNLEEDPPKMKTQEEEKALGIQLTSIQKLFSLRFPLEDKTNHLLLSRSESGIPDAETSAGSVGSSLPLRLINLSCCMQDTDITVPTLNGYISTSIDWMLESKQK